MSDIETTPPKRTPNEIWRVRGALWSAYTGEGGTLVVNESTGAAAFYFTLPTGNVDAMRIAAEDIVAGAHLKIPDGHPAKKLHNVLVANEKVRAWKPRARR